MLYEEPATRKIALIFFVTAGLLSLITVILLTGNISRGTRCHVVDNHRVDYNDFAGNSAKDPCVNRIQIFDSNTTEEFNVDVLHKLCLGDSAMIGVDTVRKLLDQDYTLATMLMKVFDNNADYYIPPYFLLNKKESVEDIKFQLVIVGKIKKCMLPIVYSQGNSMEDCEYHDIENVSPVLYQNFIYRIAYKMNENCFARRMLYTFLMNSKPTGSCITYYGDSSLPVPSLKDKELIAWDEYMWTPPVAQGEYYANMLGKAEDVNGRLINKKGFMMNRLPVSGYYDESEDNKYTNLTSEELVKIPRVYKYADEKEKQYITPNMTHKENISVSYNHRKKRSIGQQFHLRLPYCEAQIDYMTSLYNYSRDIRLLICGIQDVSVETANLQRTDLDNTRKNMEKLTEGHSHLLKLTNGMEEDFNNLSRIIKDLGFNDGLGKDWVNSTNIRLDSISTRLGYINNRLLSFPGFSDDTVVDTNTGCVCDSTGTISHVEIASSYVGTFFSAITGCGLFFATTRLCRKRKNPKRRKKWTRSTHCKADWKSILDVFQKDFRRDIILEDYSFSGLHNGNIPFDVIPCKCQHTFEQYMRDSAGVIVGFYKNANMFPIYSCELHQRMFDNNCVQYRGNRRMTCMPIAFIKTMKAKRCLDQLLRLYSHETTMASNIAEMISYLRYLSPLNFIDAVKDESVPIIDTKDKMDQALVQGADIGQVLGMLYGMMSSVTTNGNFMELYNDVLFLPFDGLCKPTMATSLYDMGSLEGIGIVDVWGSVSICPSQSMIMENPCIAQITLDIDIMEMIKPHSLQCDCIGKCVPIAEMRRVISESQTQKEGQSWLTNLRAAIAVMMTSDTCPPTLHNGMQYTNWPLKEEAYSTIYAVPEKHGKKTGHLPFVVSYDNFSYMEGSPAVKEDYLKVSLPERPEMNTIIPAPYYFTYQELAGIMTAELSNHVRINDHLTGRCNLLDKNAVVGKIKSEYPDVVTV